MGRQTKKKMEHNRMIAIKDIPNAILGWYSASRTYPKKLEAYKNKHKALLKLCEKAKLQKSSDSLFKEYIRKKYKDIYWEAVKYIQSKNPTTSKEYGKAIQELKAETSR